ncbi:hypothetical protein EWB00_005845 [Schistosoma japonicum]|uniref:Uncharacterized protein n=1 Tax=Schistosoma japonicum TaxID=6182 RepID=A0A4Z2D0C3_SCHJA|nr:hypothetical protein EWB00_005845 [Schistosoma japonicum]
MAYIIQYDYANLLLHFWYILFFVVMLDIVDARSSRSFQYNIAFVIPLVIGLTLIVCLIGILLVICYRRKRRNKKEKNSSTCTSSNHKQLEVNGKTDSNIKLKVNELQSSKIHINSSTVTTTSPSLYPKTTTITRSISPRCPTQPPLPIIKNKKSFEVN